MTAVITPSTPMFRHFANLRHIHFVGIGGAGMSGIAEVLLDYDLEVTGSDQAASEATRHLEALGVKVWIGHSPEHVAGADLVVRSSAIHDDNPEIGAARARGITVIRRAEMLAELMRLKYGIAVAGTHGKTTTTSLVGTILTEANLDPTVIVGGRLRVSGTGARLGKSMYMVVEADEFDRSFLRLQPVLAVITTIDVDHLDTYKDLADIEAAFAQFADTVPFFGQVITCLDDKNVQTLLPKLAGRRVLTYGFSPQADLVAVDVRSEGGGSRFTVRHAQRGTGTSIGTPSATDGVLGEVAVPLPGRHNVQNALAAIGVALAVGLDFAAIAKGIAAFKGVHRRFERLGTFQGAAVVDDYAHHPAEVAATLQAAREAFPGARLHAVFQPHLYSRTRDLATDFGRSLLGADAAWVTDVYAAREEPIPGVSGALVVDAARSSGHRNVRYVDHWRELPPHLRETVAASEVVLTMGAGDVFKLGQQLVAEGAA